ncbi:MAG TPA: hypothetical protein VLV50_08935 [Stellaceae bacterium]|nr:hypothetical protein [Stellaceae bacterium]
MARPRKRLEQQGEGEAADAFGDALAAAERALGEALRIASGAQLRIGSPALRRKLARALGLDGDG